MFSLKNVDHILTEKHIFTFHLFQTEKNKVTCGLNHIKLLFI